MLKVIGSVLAIVLLYLQWRSSAGREGAKVEKRKEKAKKDIRRFDEILAKGDLDIVARKLLELRLDILHEITSL